MKLPFRTLMSCSLLLTLVACRQQPATLTPAQVGDAPNNADLASNRERPPGLTQADFETRLAGVCRITKISEGDIPLSEKPVFAITEAPRYQEDIADNSLIFIRDTPETNYDIIGKLPDLDAELRDVTSGDLNDTPFILCSHQTTNPNDGETCWYLNEEGWYGSLASYGTQATLYLVEAKSLDVIAQTQLQRPSLGCPETWTLPGDSREQVRDAGSIDVEQVRTWLNSLP
ncbi:MAG: hypothetical protein HLUCCO16_02140 [Phormidium sp. OSCR]|nr:MAG: hypothetical protein HLUCCO16_02140 [Phormidium sp. OSCR]